MRENDLFSFISNNNTYHRIRLVMLIERPLLFAKNLTKVFNEFPVINDLNLEIHSDSLGLLGPNGSGKTTLIKLMLGLIQPTEGEIVLDDPGDDLRVISDQPRLPEHLTIDEWIELIEDIYGPATRNVDIQSDFGLEGDWKIKALSAGQKRKAALLLAFYGQPKLIILDEPTNFLDIVSREYILKLLKDHLKYTKSKLIIATHRIEEIRVFCNDVIMLKEGELLKSVSLEDQNPQMYSFTVDNPKKFVAELESTNLFYFTESTYLGEIVKVEASDAAFTAVSRFMLEGGSVQTFQAIDELQRSIEELLH